MMRSKCEITAQKIDKNSFNISLNDHSRHFVEYVAAEIAAGKNILVQRSLSTGRERVEQEETNTGPQFFCAL